MKAGLYCNFTTSKDAMPSAAVKESFSQCWPGMAHSSSTSSSGSNTKRLVTSQESTWADELRKISQEPCCVV